MFRIADLTLEQPRRPAYTPRPHALGVGSMMGFPLFTEDEAFDVLRRYAQEGNTELREVARRVGERRGLS
ncbi:ANTAR domain-containing protein [Streptomyces sp. NBC_00637]|uniref:ANTAR domain-containing protein n=1 Tax=Streptomyces sp. NBC_00637 TaxID=2903667 RepID=UPI00324AA5BA